MLEISILILAKRFFAVFIVTGAITIKNRGNRQRRNFGAQNPQKTSSQSIDHGRFSPENLRYENFDPVPKRRRSSPRPPRPRRLLRQKFRSRHRRPNSLPPNSVRDARAPQVHKRRELPDVPSSHAHSDLHG